MPPGTTPPFIFALYHALDSRRVRTALPTVLETRILRFDTRLLYDALDTRRAERGLTWAQVNKQTRTETPTSLRNLARGGRTGFPPVLNWCRWLERPVAAFTRGTIR